MATSHVIRFQTGEDLRVIGRPFLGHSDNVLLEGRRGRYFLFKPSAGARESKAAERIVRLLGLQTPGQFVGTVDGSVGTLTRWYPDAISLFDLASRDRHLKRQVSGLLQSSGITADLNLLAAVIGNADANPGGTLLRQQGDLCQVAICDLEAAWAATGPPVEQVLEINPDSLARLRAIRADWNAISGELAKYVLTSEIRLTRERIETILDQVSTKETLVVKRDKTLRPHGAREFHLGGLQLGGPHEIRRHAPALADV